LISTAFAPAKINLFLHVGPTGADGYHPICSWMTFADLCDRLDLQPGSGVELDVEGPFAADLAGTPGVDNLAVRAARALLAAAGRRDAGRLTLHKALPVAAGLGGGSSDAGAALRLLRRTLDLAVPDRELEAIAASIGADGPACLWRTPVIAEGRGERLSPAPRAPILDAVLVNPGVACSTGAVYRAFDAATGASADLRPRLPDAFDDLGDLVEALAACRNDLEAPAAAIAPETAEVLVLLRAAPECLLARLSGSGATCFALCADAEAAERLCAVILAARPDWWVRGCRLNAAIGP